VACVVRSSASNGSSCQTHQLVTATPVESTRPLRQPVGRGELHHRSAESAEIVALISEGLLLVLAVTKVVDR